MGDLKPLGSEKLNSDEKLKRILELTYYNQKNKTQSSHKPEMIKESKSGGVFGIVKEKDGYYVKKGLNEQSLDYIGGMFMKNKNKFSSYAEAFKRLEFLKGQEELQEATKYVLKAKPSQEEAPSPEPSVDAAPAPAPEGDVAPTPEAGGEEPLPMPSDEVPSEPSAEEPSSEEPTSGEAKPSDYMAEVQKFAGKLGQELRDQKAKMESDDIKYVLNMIISAVDLDKLDLEDLEEISKKFEREEEVEGEPESETPSDEEVPSEEPSDEEVPAEVPSEEGELEEYDSIAALEEFIDTPIENDEIDLSKYADLGKGGMSEEDVVELDLDEIKNEINKSVGETLSKYFK